MIDAAAIAAAAGALGLGSVVGAYIAGGKDRRAARAAVLDHIREIEFERWAPTDWLKLRRHTTALTAGALVAQLPREVVAEYVALVQAAAQLSQENYEADPESEYANGINGKVADLVESAARLVIVVAWSSRPIALVRAALGIRRIRQLESTIDEQSFSNRLHSARRRAL